MSDEEFLRENWDRVEVNYYPECADWGFFTANGLYSLPNQPTRERLYASGAEFTRDRLEEIRQLEVAVYDMDGDGDWRGHISLSPSWGLSADFVKSMIRTDRLTTLAKERIADLKTGMKPKESKA